MENESLSHSKDNLELSSETFRTLSLSLLDRIGKFIDELPDRPVYQEPSADSSFSGLMEPIPQKGTEFNQLLDHIFKDLLSSGLENASPGNLAYVPGGGLPQAALADMLTAAVNRYTTVWGLSPGLAELETTVLRWFMDMFGFPTEARGILTSGGSLATFSAVLAARQKHLDGNLKDATIYVSDVIHYAVCKAVTMAGLPSENIREIPSDTEFRINIEELEKRIQKDQQAGKRPFLIVGTAGATRTGSVDNLNALADIAQDKKMWLHVDAAYGGFFQLTQTGRTLLAGIERADSIALDPHKALFIPYGSGALLVRNGEDLRQAHRDKGRRYSPRQSDPARMDFCEYSPELSRELRGLRIWLPLKMHGIAPFRDNLDEKLALTRWAATQLKAIDGIEVMNTPQLSVVNFRLVKDGLNNVKIEQLNRELLKQVNAKKRVHIIGVVVHEKYVLRICILSFRTHQKQVQWAIDDIRQGVSELL